MGITVAQMPAGCGAEISGLDLAQPLARPTIETVYKAWLDRAPA